MSLLGRDMDMGGNIRLSFHSRVLLTVLGLCWILVGVFMVFQYHREKEFKAELLDMELQMHNSRIIDDMRRGESPDSIISRIDSPLDGLRVTVVGADGKVLYDSKDRSPLPQANHNQRPEIKQARSNGTGFSVDRFSESDGQEYFYSARLGDDGLVVRSAAPYNHSLQEFLKADSTLLWVMSLMALVLSLGGYLATRKISLSITRLNRFAEKAERGEPIFSDDAFPGDELGSIASHIVRLYIQRDRRHREAMRQEQEKIRLKKQLTNNINHELKTPVAAMIVCLELIRDHPELSDDKKQEFFERIMANARRLDSLLKDVSTITRMDEGQGMIEKEQIDLRALINEIVAEERLLTDMEISASVPRIIITGNRPLLESVFRNLIDNAIAYSGGTRISICADPEGNFIVRDNGRGIPVEHLPHVFERFYRIDKGRSRAAGGTGLGLAIVRNAVAIHGGKITVVNDNGLRFDFSLGNPAPSNPELNKKATKD